ITRDVPVRVAVAVVAVVAVAVAVLATVVRGRRGVGGQAALRGGRALGRAAAAAAATAAAAVHQVRSAGGRALVGGAAQDRLVVVVLLVEHLGSAGGSLGTHDVVGTGGLGGPLVLVLLEQGTGRTRPGLRRHGTRFHRLGVRLGLGLDLDCLGDLV